MTQANDGSTTEVEILQARLEQLQAKIDGLRSIEIYEQAKKKLLVWLAGVLAVISLFGVLSIKSLTAAIQENIEQEATNSIIEDLKEGILDSHEQAILDSVKVALANRIEGTVETEIEAILQEVAERVRSQPGTTRGGDALAQTIEDKYHERKYFVVVLSGVRRKPMLTAQAEWQEKVWNPGTVQVNLCRSRTYPRMLALALGPPAPLERARHRRERAVEAGFPVDAFLSSPSKYDCPVAGSG